MDPSVYQPWWWDEVVQAIFQNWLAIASLAVAFLTLGFAVWVAVRQFKIMNRQTDLMLAQDAIVQEQLARRAVLSIGMEIVPTEVHGQMHKHGVHIENDGNKMATNFHWTVYVREE